MHVYNTIFKILLMKILILIAFVQVLILIHQYRLIVKSLKNLQKTQVL
jgi:hypothetical protein